MRDISAARAAAPSLLPYIALGFGILALSLSSLFIRWAHAPGPVTSFYRMAFATLILLPFFTMRVRRAGLPPLRWMIFPAAAGLFSALDHTLWSSALGLTRMANATLMNYMAPVWVGLFAALVWKEYLTGPFWFGLGITLAGAAVVLGTDMLLAPEMSGGNWLALVSSLFYAAYFLATQRGRSVLDTLAFTWLEVFFCALVLLFVCRGLDMPFSGFDPTTWLVFFCAALISQVGGYFAIGYALGYLPASVVSPSMVFQPVLTALLAIPFAGEMLAPLQWLGGLAVIAGIYLVNNGRERAL